MSKRNCLNPYERQFLKDFEILVQPTPEEKQEGLYDVCDFEKAQEQMALTHVLDDKGQKYSVTCDIEDFKRFGSGIYLLFKFLKMAIVVFGILSIVSLINILILVISQKNLTERQSTFKTILFSTTIGNMEEGDYFYVIFINYVMAIFMFVALIVWNEKQAKYIIECSNEIALTSYFTVILTKIPNNYKEIKLKELLEREIGEVAEIYTVRDFGNDMLNYKEINHIVEEYKEERALMRLSNNTRISKMLTQLFLQLRSYYSKLKKQLLEACTYKPCFAFIQFRKVQSRQRLLEELTLFPCFSKPQRLLYDQEELEIEQCLMEPGGIIWENLHLSKTSRVLRFAFQVFLIITILILSTILIFLLSSMQISFENSIYRFMTKEEILSLNDDYALLSFCINLSFSQFYQEEAICKKHSYEYWKLTIMTILIPFTISISKFILIQIMKALVHFRRYPYEIKRIHSQAIIIFLFYFFATGLLQLIIYLMTADQKLSFFQVFTPLIQNVVHEDFDPTKIVLHTDFTIEWYKTAVINIVMIGAISFNMSAVGIILYSWIRRRICQYFAKKQKLQIRMKEWLKGESLEIQYIYGAALTVIFYSLLFGATFPLNYLFTFISLLVIYWSNKYVFIQFCQKPLTYSHSINQFVIRLLFFGIVMHCIMVPVFFKSKGIGNRNQELKFFERILNMGYYLAIIVFVVIYLLMKKPMIILWKEYKNYKAAKELEDPTRVQRKHYSLPTTIRKIQRKELRQSYSMHESSSYKNILKTLYTINKRERTRPTCLLNPQLSHLIEENSEINNENHKAFLELFEYVHRDAQQFKKSKGRLVKNPYQKEKKKLKKIFYHEITVTKSNLNCNTDDQIMEKVEKENGERRQSKNLHSQLQEVIEEQEYQEESSKNADPPLSSEARLSEMKK